MSDVRVEVTPAPPLVVEVVEEGAPPVEVALPAPPAVVEVRVPGPAGPKGEPGGAGPGGSDAHYVHRQDVPASLWRCTHDLGKRPAVSVFDTAGREWHPDALHESANVTLLDFGRLLVAGIAYFN